MYRFIHLFIAFYIYLYIDVYIWYVYRLEDSKNKITAWRDTMAVQGMCRHYNASLSHHASLFQQEKHAMRTRARRQLGHTLSTRQVHEPMQLISKQTLFWPHDGVCSTQMHDGGINSSPNKLIFSTHVVTSFARGWTRLLVMSQMDRFSAVCPFPDCVVFARIIVG